MFVTYRSSDRSLIVVAGALAASALVSSEPVAIVRHITGFLRAQALGR
jgi:hypothetical protein